MIKMTATKMLTYDNRRLRPGEDFEAKSERDRKVLLATRKAIVKRTPSEVPPPPEDLKERITKVIDSSPNDLATVRAEYRRVTGKLPHYTWSAEHIRGLLAKSV